MMESIIGPRMGCGRVFGLCMMVMGVHSVVCDWFLRGVGVVGRGWWE